MSTTDPNVTPEPAPKPDLSAVTTDDLVAELTSRSSGGLFVTYASDTATDTMQFNHLWWGNLLLVLGILGKTAHDLYARLSEPAAEG